MRLSCELAWLGGEAAEAGCPARDRGGPAGGGDAGRADRRRLSPRRPHAPRARQRALARLPARAAGADARGRGVVLDLAGADVRAGRDARPRLLLRPLARRVRRDGAGGDHVRRRVPLPPPRARRHALRRPQRDGPRRARRRAGGRAAVHAARRLLPARRHRALPRPRRRRVGRARRRCSPSAGRRGSAPRSTACARSTRTPRGWSPSGRRAGRCTRTSPSSRRRTRTRSRPTAARRPRCSPTPARSARASPRSTRRT